MIELPRKLLYFVTIELFAKPNVGAFFRGGTVDVIGKEVRPKLTPDLALSLLANGRCNR